MTHINVIDGDIADVKAQALITAINSSGLWFGGIDGVIMKAAGGMFHGQAQAAMPLHDGDIVYARKTQPHRGSFDDVLFVVDELQVKAYSIVSNALRSAAQRRIKSVSIAPIRTGVMAGVFEPRDVALKQFALAIRDFIDDDASSIDEITTVIYHNREDYEFLLREFNLV